MPDFIDEPFRAHAVRLDWQSGLTEIQLLDKHGNVRAVAELAGSIERFIDKLRDCDRRATAVLYFRTDDLSDDEI